MSISPSAAGCFGTGWLIHAFEQSVRSGNQRDLKGSKVLNIRGVTVLPALEPARSFDVGVDPVVTDEC